MSTTRHGRQIADDSKTLRRCFATKGKYLRCLTCAVWARSRLISVCATVHQTPCICMHIRHEVNGTLENNRALAARSVHARGVRVRACVCTSNVRRSRRPEWERYRFRIPFCYHAPLLRALGSRNQFLVDTTRCLISLSLSHKY